MAIGGIQGRKEGRAHRRMASGDCFETSHQLAKRLPSMPAVHVRLLEIALQQYQRRTVEQARAHHDLLLPGRQRSCYAGHAGWQADTWWRLLHLLRQACTHAGLPGGRSCQLPVQR